MMHAGPEFENHTWLCGSGHIRALNCFKAHRAARCYPRVSWGYDSCTHLFVAAPYIWQIACHRHLMLVHPASWLPCPASLGRLETHYELSLGDPSPQLALQILLRILLLYTEITRQTRGAQEHLWWADDCRAGGSSTEGRRPGGHWTSLAHKSQGFGNQCKSHSWHWASSL